MRSICSLPAHWHSDSSSTVVGEITFLPLNQTSNVTREGFEVSARLEVVARFGLEVARLGLGLEFGVARFKVVSFGGG